MNPNSKLISLGNWVQKVCPVTQLTVVKKIGLRCCDGQFCFALFRFIYLILYVYMYMCGYVCNMCMPSTLESHKRVSDPLERELQIARHGDTRL